MGNKTWVAMAAHPSGCGYWMAASDGTVLAFGTASTFSLSQGSIADGSSVVGIASSASGNGYWLVTSSERGGLRRCQVVGGC